MIEGKNEKFELSRSERKIQGILQDSGVWRNNFHICPFPFVTAMEAMKGV